MNNPHVKSLCYRVQTAEDVDYDNASPLVTSTDEFELVIDGESALFSMKKHYATVPEARTVADGFLRAWEILIGLECGPDELWFVFDRAKIVDLSPPQKDGKRVNSDVNGTAYVEGNASMRARLHASRSAYPALPRNFVASPDAETMYLRYKACRQGREPLTSMAYMCLTILLGRAALAEGGGKKREAAAERYAIDKTVLSKLGELCSKRGDRLQARKLPREGEFVPLSPEEKTWTIAVIKALIQRVGEYDFDPQGSFPIISMADFPRL